MEVGLVHDRRLAELFRPLCASESPRIHGTRFTAQAPPRAAKAARGSCTTTLLPRQRIRLVVRWVQPTRITVRPALRARGVRHRSSSQQPRHGRVGLARQRGGRMAPLRWGVRDSRGAASGTDGNGHGRAAGSPPHRREECPLTPITRPFQREGGVSRAAKRSWRGFARRTRSPGDAGCYVFFRQSSLY